MAPSDDAEGSGDQPNMFEILCENVTTSMLTHGATLQQVSQFSASQFQSRRPQAMPVALHILTHFPLCNSVQFFEFKDELLKVSYLSIKQSIIKLIVCISRLLLNQSLTFLLCLVACSASQDACKSHAALLKTLPKVSHFRLDQTFRLPSCSSQIGQFWSVSKTLQINISISCDISNNVCKISTQ